MTRRIKLDQIGNFSKEKYEQLLRVTVLETDKRLKEESPVDTGRFRLSWVISENGTPGFDAGTNVTPYEIAPARKLDYTTERAGNTYHIHNNLPYAEPLAIGHSKQAPAGWIDRIAREMSDWARQEANRLGGQD